jgi:hypothetical protein
VRPKEVIYWPNFMTRRRGRTSNGVDYIGEELYNNLGGEVEKLGNFYSLWK